MILPITLNDLSPRTRDWLLAKSARLELPPLQTLNKVLEAVAKRELKDGRQPQTEGIGLLPLRDLGLPLRILGEFVTVGLVLLQLRINHLLACAAAGSGEGLGSRIHSGESLLGLGEVVGNLILGQTAVSFGHGGESAMKAPRGYFRFRWPVEVMP